MLAFIILNSDSSKPPRLVRQSNQSESVNFNNISAVCTIPHLPCQMNMFHCVMIVERKKEKNPQIFTFCFLGILYLMLIAQQGRKTISVVQCWNAWG